MNPLDERRANYSFTLTLELYGDFLCNLFDLWFADVSQDRFVYIQYFDNLVAMFEGYLDYLQYDRNLYPQLVVEADGSFILVTFMCWMNTFW